MISFNVLLLSCLSFGPILSVHICNCLIWVSAVSSRAVEPVPMSFAFNWVRKCTRTCIVSLHFSKA